MIFSDRAKRQSEGAPVARLLLTSLLALALGLPGIAARADNHNMDYFGHNTSSPKTTVSVPAKPATQSYARKSPAELWYEMLDKNSIEHSPTNAERFILTRDCGAKEERVREWMKTAGAEAKKYHDMAQILRNVSVPAEMQADSSSYGELLTYKKELAQWYDDSASWFEDYIKPRAPAKTVEQLNDQLTVMHNRSVAIKESLTHLQMMDSKLRDRYHVHKFEDFVWDYAKKPLH